MASRHLFSAGFCIGVLIAVSLASNARAASLAAKMLYLPKEAETQFPSHLTPPEGMTAFQIKSSAFEINGWQKIDPKAKSPVVIFFYGNGMNMAAVSQSPVREFLESSKLDYVFYDYPNYGLSKGTMSEKNYVEAGDRVLDRVRRIAPGRDIVLWGDSMGCAIAIQVAAYSLTLPAPVKSLILMAPWTSFTDLVKYRVHIGWFAKHETAGNRYDSLHAARFIVAKSSMRALVIQGVNDEVIPVAMGKAIYDAFGSARAMWVAIPNAGHNDVFRDTMDLGFLLSAFIDRGE